MGAMGVITTGMTIINLNTVMALIIFEKRGDESAISAGMTSSKMTKSAGEPGDKLFLLTMGIMEEVIMITPMEDMLAAEDTMANTKNTR